MLLVGGCSRIDTLRLAHANGGTPINWPPGTRAVELELEPPSEGGLWLPVSVDGSAPVPFLLQASAGAIALTGARASGFGPTGAGRLSLREPLLPGVRGGVLVRQRRVMLGGVELGDQSMLLVEAAGWPHPRPRGPAAGVLGYDLLRRVVLELETDARRLTLHRPDSYDFGTLAEVQRLAVLDRVPYFEAWIEPEQRPGGWVRLQFEPGAPGGICLDAGPGHGVAVIAGRRVPLEREPCADVSAAGPGDQRAGVFGAAALAGLVVTVDYEGRRIGFRAPD